MQRRMSGTPCGHWIKQRENYCMFRSESEIGVIARNESRDLGRVTQMTGKRSQSRNIAGFSRELEKTWKYWRNDVDFSPRDTDLNEKTNGTNATKNKKINHNVEEKIDMIEWLFVSIDLLLWTAFDLHVITDWVFLIISLYLFDIEGAQPEHRAQDVVCLHLWYIFVQGGSGKDGPDHHDLPEPQELLHLVHACQPCILLKKKHELYHVSFLYWKNLIKNKRNVVQKDA